MPVEVDVADAWELDATLDETVLVASLVLPSVLVPSLEATCPPLPPAPLAPFPQPTSAKSETESVADKEAEHEKRFIVLVDAPDPRIVHSNHRSASDGGRSVSRALTRWRK